MITGRTYSRSLRKNQTDAEKLLWYHLRNRQLFGIKFRRQQIIGKYIVDFVSFKKRIIIELDGGQHNFANREFKDDIRTKWLTKEGFLVLRFWNNDVIKNLEGVLEQIKIFVSR